MPKYQHERDDLNFVQLSVLNTLIEIVQTGPILKYSLVRQLWWVDLGWLPLAHPVALSLPLLNRREGKSKMEKLQCWNKGSLMRKAILVHVSRARRGIYSLFPISRQMSSHFLESRT